MVSARNALPLALFAAALTSRPVQAAERSDGLRWAPGARVPLVVFGAAEDSERWRAVHQATKVWHEATGVSLELRAADARRPAAGFAEDGQSSLSLVTERSCRGRLGEACLDANHHGATKLHRRLQPPGPIEEVDIQLAVPSSAGPSVVTALALHELGHALGLGHSCPASPCLAFQTASVMYPAPLETGRSLAIALTAYDREAAAKLYPEHDEGDTPRLAVSVGVGLAAAALGLAVVRRRRARHER